MTEKRKNIRTVAVKKLEIGILRDSDEEPKIANGVVKNGSRKSVCLRTEHQYNAKERVRLILKRNSLYVTCIAVAVRSTNAKYGYDSVFQFEEEGQKNSFGQKLTWVLLELQEESAREALSRKIETIFEKKVE